MEKLRVSDDATRFDNSPLAESSCQTEHMLTTYKGGNDNVAHNARVPGSHH